MTTSVAPHVSSAGSTPAQNALPSDIRNHEASSSAAATRITQAHMVEKHALVAAWTAYGGSQFVDSPGTGRYHSYLCDEVVPFVDDRYRTLASAAHRGIAGKSSGGFGAMITPMLRPDLFGGFASHAGDALYELCYMSGFGRTVRALRDYDGSYENFWEDFASRPPMSKETDGDLVMTYGVAAAFSADDDGTVRLPFDLHTGRTV